VNDDDLKSKRCITRDKIVVLAKKFNHCRNGLIKKIAQEWSLPEVPRTCSSRTFGSKLQVTKKKVENCLKTKIQGVKEIPGKKPFYFLI